VLISFTEDYVEVGFWSTIEVPVGVICACMPAVRSLFSLAFPRIFGATRRGDSTDVFGQSLTRLSSMPKHAEPSNVHVKHEWTVIREHERNASELGLMHELAMDEHEPRTRRMTLTKQSDGWRSKVRDAEEANIPSSAQLPSKGVHKYAYGR
jgi:hypothetical protein